MTSAIWLLWRARLRNSSRKIIALAVLTALGGGICLAVAAGARRTAGAYDEVLDLTDGSELGSSYVARDPNEVGELVATMPAIDDFTERVGFQSLLPATPVAGLTSFAHYNDPVLVERPIVLEGRMPERANEVFLNEASATRTTVAVGERLDVVIATPDFTEFYPETMVVVGVGVFADEVYEDETAAKPALIYSKDFVDAHRQLIAWGGIAVRVLPGVARSDAIAQMRDRGFTIDNNRRADRDRARAAIRPLAVTLWALALLAGLATIIVVGQALQRLVQRSPAEARSLAATGCSRAILLATDVGVGATIGTAGAIGAIGVAVLASPLFPQGRARRISDLRGIDVDVTTLGLGAAVLLLALIALMVAASLRRTERGALRPGSAPGVLGISPAVSTGVRFATGRRGLLGAVGGAAIGLTFIVAAVTFTGSMDHLVSRSELAGFNWDLLGRDAYGQIDNTAVAEHVRDNPTVERITGLTFADVTVRGTPVPASVWAAIKGSPWPSLTAGRAPAGPNEILVSQRTLDDLGSAIGDTLTVGFTGEDNHQPVAIEINMTVVGTAVSPAIGLAGSDTPRLDEGVLVRQEDIADRGIEYGSAMLFDVADGADPESVKAQFPYGLPDDLDATTEWFATAQPAEVIQTDDAINVLVLAIAALLIGVMATVANNLLGFVRQRRNAFAVLKALGFTPRQIRSTVLSQSGLVVGAALVLAVPLGIAAGRSLYQGFAGGIGVIVEPVVPLLALAAAVLVALALVQAVALVPARQARRTDAASELRWE